MSIIHAPEETPLDFRQLLVPGVLLIFFAVYFIRLWYLQVVISEDLKAEANRTNEISVPLLAPRGKIVDREGRMLAGVQPQWVVTAIPNELKKNPDSLVHAAHILGIKPDVIEKKLKDASHAPDLPTVVFIGATNQQASRFAESDQVKGFSVETQNLRIVPDTKSVSHLLGYVGRPNDIEQARLKEKGYKAAQYIGRDGLERLYETDLMGQEGQEKVAVDVKRRPIRRLPGEAPIPGTSLELSIDLDIQRRAEELLQKADGSGRGAIVALDPRNGEVIALASAPTFDLADFAGGISQDKYEAYTKDPATPFLKRPIAGQYSPGSTFKIVNAISAAIKGKLDLNRYVTCNGGTRIGNRFIKCQNHPAGSLSFYRAMSKSCNTYFIDLALRQGAGPLGDTAHELGLGLITGIDVPGERSAFCPTSEWIDEQVSKRNWYDGHTANMGIGQGELRVTPIQMAQIAALVGNGGIAYTPHLVRAKLPPASERVPVEPKVAIKLEATEAFWSTMRQALSSVISEGTARGARIEGTEWAGKTGSTEHRGSKTHAWFVGFAPAKNPTIAIAVLVENAGHGGDVAAPIGKEVVKMWLDKQNQRLSSSSRNLDEDSEASADPSLSPSL